MTDSAIRKLVDECYALLDVDPQAAIQKARALPDVSLPDGATTSYLRAAFFIDAADQTKNLPLAREGREVMAALHVEFPARLDVTYNLANALHVESQLHPRTGASWYLDTLQLRLEARAAYQKVIDAKTEGDTSARAQVNLGNELWGTHRWAEAYDAYEAATSVDPTHPVALLRAASVLLRARDLGIGDHLVAGAAASRRLRAAARQRDRLRAIAGQVAVEGLERLLALDLPSGDLATSLPAGDFERFVAEHRLALAPTLEGIRMDLRLWDFLQIRSLLQSTDSGAGIPPTIAIFNAAKGEYLAARRICYLAVSGKQPDTGAYSDTLDYAVYGIHPSLLVLAQRAAMDVLDKIALMTTEYLGLDEDPQLVNFAWRWHQKDNGRIQGWHPALAEEFELGNRGFLALADMAADLKGRGFLRKKKRLRDAGTHRALVIHDIAATPSRESRYVTHVDEASFRAVVIDTLRLARAALLYAVEAIAQREDRLRPRYGFLPRLTMPPHDWVRGDAEELPRPDEDEE